MNYIFGFLLLMSISGTQGQDADCPATALDCPSICACYEKKEGMNTRQTRLLNKECYMCGKGSPNSFSPMGFAHSLKLESKENSENLELDEDN